MLEAHVVSRNKSGRFLAVSDVISSTTLYHIVSQKELATLTSDNIYSPLSIALEGYIHFSKLDLIMPIANDAYIDREVLYLCKSLLTKMTKTFVGLAIIPITIGS